MRLLFFAVPLILEYLVIINVYNTVTSLNAALEYAFMDLFALIGLILLRKYDLPELLFVTLALIGHIQWYVHDPFEEWPTWWPVTKTDNDIRHRVEYYDTHVMIFSIYLVLILRRLPIKSNTESSANNIIN
jgi:hypothetical protein